MSRQALPHTVIAALLLAAAVATGKDEPQPPAIRRPPRKVGPDDRLARLVHPSAYGSSVVAVEAGAVGGLIADLDLGARLRDREVGSGDGRVVDDQRVRGVPSDRGHLLAEPDQLIGIGAAVAQRRDGAARWGSSSRAAGGA